MREDLLDKMREQKEQRVIKNIKDKGDKRNLSIYIYRVVVKNINTKYMSNF